MTLRAVITDWGGVLTAPLQDAISVWLTADEIDVASYRETMRAWFGGAYAGTHAMSAFSGGNLIHALEDGTLPAEEFERLLAAELRTVDGGPVSPDGLLSRMFAAFHPIETMYEALHAAKAGGLATALLSNSWGNAYPRELWSGLFDTVVISGEVGMRKPGREIFRHTVEVLDLRPEDCVFIDDIAENIRTATDLGMTGVLHTTPEDTRAQLSDLLRLPL
ncbi:HAD family hydrolase [Actinocorallia sp. API 0066]|uniref:HAD family hydrolase n=1 Tax=Actinocorallia sp. API 0066 TaxID=2896846 RepID=UPI0035AB951E